MSGTRYAIVVAMEREIAPLVRGWQVFLGNSQKFFERDDAIVVCGGLGPAAAKDAAEAVIARRDPKILVSAGYAGALTSALGAGDLVIPAEIINAQTGEHFATSQGSGTLLSTSGVASPSGKRALAQSFRAESIDMEAAAVARVARAQRRDFLAVKAISDELDFELPPMDRFISANGAFQTARFAFHAALHPSLWPTIRKLARNSQRASLTLCSALEHLINGKDPAALISAPAHAGTGVVK
jgi:adenosylhomocysteine nucleosidase